MWKRRDVGNDDARGGAASGSRRLSRQKGLRLPIVNRDLTSAMSRGVLEARAAGSIAMLAGSSSSGQPPVAHHPLRRSTQRYAHDSVTRATSVDRHVIA